MLYTDIFVLDYIEDILTENQVRVKSGKAELYHLLSSIDILDVCVNNYLRTRGTFYVTTT